jgi:hypothetical protein
MWPFNDLRMVFDVFRAPWQKRVKLSTEKPRLPMKNGSGSNYQLMKRDVPGKGSVNDNVLWVMEVITHRNRLDSLGGIPRLNALETAIKRFSRKVCVFPSNCRSASGLR